METVRVSHWPITWPIYLPCTVAQGQPHCASNIISNSHPFHSKWVKPPIPELQQFQYFTLKIQGQGHGWGQSLKSQCETNILSTHIPFVPCQSAISFLRYDFFKIWPWNGYVDITIWTELISVSKCGISISIDIEKSVSICSPNIHDGAVNVKVHSHQNSVRHSKAPHCVPVNVIIEGNQLYIHTGTAEVLGHLPEWQNWVLQPICRSARLRQ